MGGKIESSKGQERGWSVGREFDGVAREKSGN
jgi:hypothetical protein